MNFHYLRWLASVATLFLVSCFEQSTVVKVGKDGAGIVHVREYSSLKEKAEDVELPEETELEARASKMGEGVRLRSVAKVKNSKGWHGHEVIYEFDDINHLVLLASDDDKKKDEFQTEVRFQLEGKVLEARIDAEAWRQNAAPDPAANEGPTIDPYAGTSGPPASGLTITPAGLDMQSEAWKKMTRGMRMGYFLQIEDPLAETNAKRRDGPLFTLMNLDVGEITESGEIEDFNELNAPSRERMEELVEDVDGLFLDLQQPVRFVFE